MILNNVYYIKYKCKLETSKRARTRQMPTFNDDLENRATTVFENNSRAKRQYAKVSMNKCKYCEFGCHFANTNYVCTKHKYSFEVVCLIV